MRVETLANLVTLYCGDCLDALDAMEENSIDSVVCDPPYHLTSIVKRFGKEGSAPAQFGIDGAFARASSGFMGKEWDGGDIAFRSETWAKVMRVLKPGGHLVAFSGTRTYHRMAVAIDDAGFEIRDQLAWVYGSGFPKSQNVAIAIDKQAGKTAARSVGFNTAGKTSGLPPIQRQELRSDHPEYAPYAPATAAAREWQGWGTALKPSWEPVVLARKPLSEGTVVANVLKWGTGALNVDATRIKTDENRARNNKARVTGSSYVVQREDKFIDPGGSGRWPANLAHDGSEEVLAGFPYTKSGSIALHHKRTSSKTKNAVGEHAAPPEETCGDSGSAARFFYTAKANELDRQFSRHPTVKPVSLMRWLVRMVTPSGGTVLDPFSGTGTTGQAAMMEGFRAVLIEREEEYQADIRRRISLVFAGDVERAKHVAQDSHETLPLFSEAAE